MTYPHTTKLHVCELRRDGLSIPQIAKQLNIRKSTISLWVRTVPLPKSILDKLKNNSLKGNAKGREILRIKRELVQIENDKTAHQILGSLIPKCGKELWQLCAALVFWCEGSKRSLSSGAVLTNSDPNLVRLFLHALRIGFPLDEGKFSVIVHLHEYHNEQQQLKFWSEITKIPLTQFRKTYLKPHTKIRKRKDYPGCVSVRYGDARLARKLDALYHTIGQYLRA